MRKLPHSFLLECPESSIIFIRKSAKISANYENLYYQL